MSDILATVAVAAGTLLCLLSAVGILRMPDVYIRLQVASKASSLGIALLVVGVAAHFDDLSTTIRAALVVVFLFLTAPVAAHVIGRAAYLAGVPLAPGTRLDELAGAYDTGTRRLGAPAPGRDETAPSDEVDSLAKTGPPGGSEAARSDEAEAVPPAQSDKVDQA